MYIGLTHLHSFLRYLVILGLFSTIVYAIINFLKNREFNSTINKLSSVSAMLVYTQFVIGLVLYFISPKVSMALAAETAEMMRDSFLRFLAVEHIAGMTVGVLFILVGRILTKKASTDREKYRRIFIFFTVGFLIIMASIPWPFRNEMFAQVFGWY